MLLEPIWEGSKLKFVGQFSIWSCRWLHNCIIYKHDKSNFFHSKGDDNPCRVSSNPCMIAFENGKIRGSHAGVSIGTLTKTQKIWRSFQALGAIAFAYSYSIILIKIQAFGDSFSGNLLTGFSFYNPYWLLDMANMAILVHLVGAYQVYCQPLFVFIERTVAEWFPNNKFIKKDIAVPVPRFKSFKLNLFRLVWKTIFVIIKTAILMLIPLLTILWGSLVYSGFGRWPFSFWWKYIVQNKIPNEA